MAFKCHADKAYLQGSGQGTRAMAIHLDEVWDPSPSESPSPSHPLSHPASPGTNSPRPQTTIPGLALQGLLRIDGLRYLRTATTSASLSGAASGRARRPSPLAGRPTLPSTTRHRPGGAEGPGVDALEACATGLQAPTPAVPLSPGTLACSCATVVIALPRAALPRRCCRPMPSMPSVSLTECCCCP